MSQTEPILRESRRSDCYRLLAACFYPPEPELLLAERTCLELAAVLDEVYPETAAGDHARMMHQQLSETGGTRLRIDHASLFLGPFELKAPPYGSVYLEKNHTLMGDTTLAAISFYKEAGLELTLHEPGDHIAVELEFMHYLSFLSAQALRGADEKEAARQGQKQQRFLLHHLGSWAPEFCSSIKRKADTLFFKELSDCLLAFIKAEIRQTETATAAP